MRKHYFAPMRFLQAYQLYQHLPMKKKTHLPDEGFEPRPMTLAYWKGKPLNFMVSCLALDEIPNKIEHRKRSQHRVFVHCPCDRLIPFGRMTQHYGGPKCRKDLIE